ncbi:Trp biosynthesis-associated membrane protein [Georgenia sp. SYP-B2076]|uniref:Trp biosynthesis-associated membrane protein n=1 Tax=Georgenia sp. SYP-B2076 TaxID=2495881 RepID=UPI000F8CFDA9|nr:Trp biosynthesis-associated membrane protein [Georgenia sp. SYP-B2076]
MNRLLERRTVVLAALLLAVALVALGAAPWVHATVATVIDVRDVSVSGSAAAPALTAGALVVGAAALAVGIGRRVAAAVGGVALLVAAVLVEAAVVSFLRDPRSPALTAASELSGVRQLSGEVVTTPWPWVAVVVGAAVALLALVPLLRGGRWQAAGRRFERGEPGRARGRSASSDATDARTRAMDDWDALGRGEDPSTEAEE